jgi:hypothetical protein
MYLVVMLMTLNGTATSGEYCSVSFLSPDDHWEYTYQIPQLEIAAISTSSLFAFYYTIDGSSTQYNLLPQWSWHSQEPFTVSIGLDTWNSLPNGDLTVRVFIRSIGLWSEDNLQIVKNAAIEVGSPSTGEFFSAPPTFQLEHSATGDVFGYQLDSENFPLRQLFGQIDESVWNLQDDGPVQISFYSQKGDLIYYHPVNVIKDTTSPVISASTPQQDNIYGIAPLPYSLSILDANLDFFGFQIDASEDLHFLTEYSGSIELQIWTGLHEGTHIFRFFAKDKVDHWTYGDEITITKDTIAPTLCVNDPTDQGIYGEIAPNYSLTINDVNLLAFGVMIDDHFNLTLDIQTGNIPQSTWDILQEGNHNLTFWTQDDAGNQNQITVSLMKDISRPQISLLFPQNNSYYHATSVPAYDLTIMDAGSIVQKYYTVNQSAPYEFSDDSNYLDPSLWASLSDGMYNLTFWVVDSVGLCSSISVIIIKDTTSPKIVICSPIFNSAFSETGPEFHLSVTEANLEYLRYQFTNSSLYFEIDPGTDFTSISGYIDPAFWNSLEDGLYTISFNAIDKLDFYYEANTTVIKDTTPAKLTVVSPINQSIHGQSAPNYAVQIEEEYLADYGVALNGTHFVFSNRTGYLDSGVWTSLPEGLQNFTFWARDTAGNLVERVIWVQKDVQPPSMGVSIFETNCSTMPPRFTFTTADPHFDRAWYRISGIPPEFSLLKEYGEYLVDAAIWRSLSDGLINFTFTSQDQAGNRAIRIIVVTKTSPTVAETSNETSIPDDQSATEEIPAELIPTNPPGSVIGVVLGGASVIVLGSWGVQKKFRTKRRRVKKI